MLGRKLTERLRRDPTIGGRAVAHLDLVDVVEPTALGDGEAAAALDLGDPAVAPRLAATRPDVVFHLAGVVSGEAEADMAKGYRVNLDGTRHLLDALAAVPGRPRVVFTSSLAVYGAPVPDPIPDDFHLTPLTSYGTQKLMGEALLADYSRRALIDGVGIRLPTITVRPGAPNRAASGFFSSIIREPLAGLPATVPVPRSTRHPHASPRAAVGYLLHAAALDTARLGPRRNLMMPGISVSVEEQIAALGRVAGPDAVALVSDEPDEAVASMIGGWPRAVAATRATELGFRCETTYDEIIRVYLDEDAPGR